MARCSPTHHASDDHLNPAVSWGVEDHVCSCCYRVLAELDSDMRSPEADPGIRGRRTDADLREYSAGKIFRTAHRR